MNIVTPESVGLSSARLARIRPAVEKHVGEEKLAGVVTLLARHGQVVHHEPAGVVTRAWSAWVIRQGLR